MEVKLISETGEFVCKITLTEEELTAILQVGLTTILKEALCCQKPNQVMDQEM